MRFNLVSNLLNQLRRFAVLATVLLLLGSILGGSLGGWHNYSDLGKSVIGIDIATVSGDTGPIGDIEPAIFPVTLPVSAILPSGQVYAANAVHPVSAVFAPHDRPPMLS